MIPRLLLFMLLCSLGKLQAQELPCKRFFSNQEGNGCRERYREDSNGLIHGKYISYFLDGTVETRGEYIHGNKQGNWLEHTFGSASYIWYEGGSFIARSEEVFTSYADAKLKAERDAIEIEKTQKAKIDSDYKNSDPCWFATNYPNDPRAEKAKQDCSDARNKMQREFADNQRKAIEEKREDEEVLGAVNQGTLSSLQNYLTKYPNGRYKSDVEILIKRIEVSDLLFGKNNPPIFDFPSSDLAKNAATQLYSRYNFERNPEWADTVFYYLLKWSADADDHQGLIKYYEIQNGMSERIRKYYEWQYLKYKCEERGCSKGTSIKLALDSITSLQRDRRYMGDNKLLLYKASMEVALGKVDVQRTLDLLSAINYENVFFYEFKVDPFVIKQFLLGYYYLNADDKLNAKRYFKAFLESADDMTINAINNFVASDSCKVPSGVKELLDKNRSLITRDSLGKYVQKK